MAVPLFEGGNYAEKCEGTVQEQEDDFEGDLEEQEPIGFRKGSHFEGEEGNEEQESEERKLGWDVGLREKLKVIFQ